MHRKVAQIDAFTLQIDLHATIAHNSVIVVIDVLYLVKSILFLGIIIRLPVLQVVIIGVWVYIEPSQ